MDCGMNSTRFRIPHQVYCDKCQKSNSLLFQTFFWQNVNASLPLYTELELYCTLLAFKGARAHTLGWKVLI